MHRRSNFLLASAAIMVVAALGVIKPTQAADWPTRPVTVIVPLGAGGNTDMMARLGTQRLSAKFGQSFIVENRPSAGGAIGTGQVATAAPDGYTLLFAPSSMLLLTPMLQKVGFDADKQLTPITNVGTGAQVLAIKRSLPATTLPEFLAYAKANPGKLNFTVAGTQNLSHLAPVLLLARAGVDVVMVPAKSGPQAVSDLMSGQVDMYFGNASELLPHINSDRIRLIATGTAERLPAAPDLPTVSETMPGFVLSSWNGFVAPAGTPEPIINAIRSEITAMAKSPEISERLIKLGIVPGGMTHDEIASSFKSDRAAFIEAMKAAGLPTP